MAAPKGNQNRRGQKLFLDAIFKVLDRRTGSRTDKLHEIEAIAEALVTRALTGDVPALREFADRVDGKVPQGVELEGHLTLGLAETLSTLPKIDRSAEKNTKVA